MRAMKHGSQSSCSNCGRRGHFFRDCKDPITSFGVIAIRNRTEGAEYLMIQRRDSMGYVELLRGKYDIHDEAYIIKLLSEMTENEIHRLKTLDFTHLWSDLWQSPPGHNCPQQQKWNQLQPKLDSLISKLQQPSWPTAEWGFPKGRRNVGETDIECAVREFCEETGLTAQDIKLLGDIGPFEEAFIGSNKVHYRHKYFIAICNADVDVAIVSDIQQREIGDIRWVSVENGNELIRPYDLTKRNVLQKIDSALKLRYKLNLY